MDTLTVTVTDGVARIVIGSDWLWALASLGWLGLYVIWCEGRELPRVAGEHVLVAVENGDPVSRDAEHTRCRAGRDAATGHRL